MSVLLLVLLIAFSNGQMYAMVSTFGGYDVVSPIDACRGEQCRKQVKAIMTKAQALENSLKKLDDTERALVRENEHDMADMAVFTSHDETKTLRNKIQVQNENLRKVRKTRVELMRTLYKLVGKLSVPQQGRLIRYLNLEHRIDIKYDNFKEGEGIPQKMKTCENKRGVDPEIDEN
ncbi:hypothetical protein EDI_206380 [Entamoeba dispar SAW760]|uniref:Uncharacterized protein n=2 Tax=Entamoeba dispar (strain ATCC PRA-260 / SAW760) TaxID=370354 RepID=B0EIL9_ENTDS|nr:uncharacterized protein EDI_206380 [Entamoeba dispar SAW760]EDR25642.1 hypothetical protein EDI_206380 [Entamoeba dispar SAW760]|eukprot:EDR25642.1 hypothetical protein EDI_206380 [Entamoeba dispar SAW760]